MRLYEMKSLPKQAGLAKLEFRTTGTVFTRHNEQLILPGTPEEEFFLLKNGTQFLMRAKFRTEDRFNPFRTE